MFVPQPSLKTFTTIRFPSINQRCSGYRTMVLYNSDESPILYQFENDPTGIISVKPSRGLIQNGHKIFIVKFTPREVKKYTQEVKMYFNLTTKFSQVGKFTFTPSILGKKTFVFNLQVSPGDCEKSTANVKVYEIKGSGLGAVGELTVDQSYTNFGGVVVGRPTQRDLVVCNRQDCEICCRLFLKQSLNGIDLPFEKCTGYKHLCHLLMTGVYPLVKISDIQGRQTAKRIKKRQLWSSFSIDCFNSYMNSDPTYRELNESAERQQTTENFPKFETQSIIDFDFGAAPLGSPMSEFVLQFHNTGPITAQWDFLYPEDLKMDLEPWANTDDDYSPQTVLDEKHFTVTPKQCQIEPGETIDVTFCFEHTCLGNFQFPVLFKMKSGREILVNFLGVTVEVDKPYIHFNSLEHMFSPVPIGVEYQPTQLYELYNAGAIAVEYVVDMDPLVDIKAVNYNYPIFNCRNPIGMVEPGHTAILEWVFSPLESKTYSVDVPIYIQEEDPIIVRFSGAGYEISRMGDTNPYSEVCNTLISDRQMIRLPDQFVSLSHDKLSFGRIPLFATKRHILIANNFSSDRNANIMWYLDKKEHEELITVIPKNYLLRPNESVIFQVNFLDRGSPAFYEMQMFCEITDETEVHGYKIELKQWLCEQERQRNEFKITEKNMEVVTPDYDKDELYVSSKRLRALLKPLKDFPTDVMAKYETLPPIGQQKESSKAQGKKHFSNSKILLWKKPVMPVCMELAVSITAQTISPEEFETFHQSEFQKYLINKTHYISSDPKEESTLSEGSSVELNRSFTTLDLTRPQVLSCLKSEKEMVTYILNYIVRGILHNTYFQMCLRDVKNEKPGYFQQFVAPIHPRHNR
ncbi:cilia- and flagella-associated protein 65-like, partial [Argonauta hians]